METSFIYGTIKFCQSPGKAGGFLWILTNNNQVMLALQSLKE